VLNSYIFVKLVGMAFFPFKFFVTFYEVFDHGF